jgi:hypothetical protein
MLNKLIKEGIISSNDIEGSTVSDAYLIGRLRQILPDKSLEAISPSDFRKKFRSFLLNLPEAEQKKLKIAKESAFAAITGLRDASIAKMRGTLVNATFEHMGNYLGEEVKNVIEEAYIKNTSLGKLVGDLKREAKDWSSKWSTVATTEFSKTLNSGICDAIIQRNRGASNDDIYCYFAVVRDSKFCKHCSRLLLWPNGQPRIFTMSELISAGSNYGRKAVDYKPSIMGLHPNCRCTVSQLPRGWEVKANGHLTFKSPDYNQYKNQKK